MNDTERGSAWLEENGFLVTPGQGAMVEEIGKLLRVLDTYQYLAETRMGYEDLYKAAQRKLDAMEESCEP